MWEFIKAIFTFTEPCECATIRQQLTDLRIAVDLKEAQKRTAALGCRLEIYRDKAKEYRWRLKSKNHRIIAVSGEGYSRLENLQSALTKVRSVFESVEEVRLKDD